MAAPLVILQAGSYDEIRNCVDLSLDANILPDAVIDQGAFGPAAEAEVLAREAAVFPAPLDPVLQGLHREQAAIYLAAARVAQALPSLTNQSLGDSHYSRTGFDGQRRHAELRLLAERELTAYLDPTKQVHIQQQFWIAMGRRGQ
jgi:hypothetical protein